MISLTRSEALSYARVELLRLALRATEVDGADGEYICRLADSWAGTLAQLSKAAPASHVSDEAWRVLNRLTATINDPALTSDALVEWVDAFPEAVVDLLADQVPEAVPAQAVVAAAVPAKAEPRRRSVGNNQSALALAA